MGHYVRRNYEFTISKSRFLYAANVGFDVIRHAVASTIDELTTNSVLLKRPQATACKARYRATASHTDFICKIWKRDFDVPFMSFFRFNRIN